MLTCTQTALGKTMRSGFTQFGGATEHGHMWSINPALSSDLDGTGCKQEVGLGHGWSGMGCC